MKAKRRWAYVGIIVVLMILIGSLFQNYGVKKDQERLTAPGTMIEVNGHQIHVYTQGSRDTPYTIVLSAGSGTTSPYADFYPLYSRMDDQRMVLYERPGYGWSEALGTPRNVDTAAEELNQVLKKSGEKGPYILIGHSMASLEFIRYAQMYPDQVAGLVFIDGVSPEYAMNFKQTSLMKIGWGALSLAKNSGLFRALSSVGITDRLFIDINGLPEQLQSVKVAMALQNMNNPDMKLELQRMPENGRIVKDHGNLGTLPLLILSSPNNGYSNWEQTQDELAELSSRVKHIVYPNASHYIHHDYSEQILNELNNFITTLP